MSVLLLADGTRIAYQLHGQSAPGHEGQRAPAFVLTNGLTTNTAFWKNVLPVWAARHTVLTWDLPGHGDSSPARTPASASVQAQAAIVAQLMAASGLEHAVQVGWSTGCQVVLEIQRRTPGLCDA